MAEQDLIDKIAIRFARGSNDVCNNCGNPVNRDNPDDVARDISGYIKEALPELAREAGYVKLTDDIPLCSECHSLIRLKRGEYGLSIACDCAFAGVANQPNKRWSKQTGGK